MKGIFRQIFDIILLVLAIYFIVPIVFNDITTESIIARTAMACALTGNISLLSEHKKMKNSLLIVALVLIIIATFIHL